MIIKQITVVTDDGETVHFFGKGGASLVTTQTPVEGQVPATWPHLSFVTAHLLIVAPDTEVKTDGA